jgi:hypothetical protein
MDDVVVIPIVFFYSDGSMPDLVSPAQVAFFEAEANEAVAERLLEAALQLEAASKSSR